MVGTSDALRTIRDRLAAWDGPPVDVFVARAIVYGPELPEWCIADDGPLGPPTEDERGGWPIIDDLGIRPILRGRPPWPTGRRDFQRLAIVGPGPAAWPTLRRLIDDLARVARPMMAPPPKGHDPVAAWLSALADAACSGRAALSARTLPMPLAWMGDLSAECVRFAVVPDLAEASARMIDALLSDGSTGPELAADPPEALTTGTEASEPIDYDAIIERASRDRKRTIRALVECMRDRDSAHFDEIKDQVHGADVEDGTIRKLASDANAYLVRIGRGHLRFQTSCLTLHKHIDPL